MIYNLEKIDRVIDKVVRDLGLGDQEIPFHDYIEWIADALQHIGSYYQFREKQTSILIKNYEGLLPCDFYKPIDIKAGCSIEPVSGGFYGGTLVNALNKAGVDYESLPAYERFHIINVQGITKPATYNEVVNKLQFNKNLIGNPSMNVHTCLDYNINFNMINTAFKDGIIELQYLAFPVDERGFPLVPDDVSFRDALFWKCAMQIAMRNPKLMKNPQLQNYDYCRQMWNKFCAQARGNANMPDLKMLERLKNNWLRMIPKFELEANNYKELGKPQRINFDGRY